MRRMSGSRLRKVDCDFMHKKLCCVHDRLDRRARYYLSRKRRGTGDMRTPYLRRVLKVRLVFVFSLADYTGL
jgi:hypothetical protein